MRSDPSNGLCLIRPFRSCTSSRAGPRRNGAIPTIGDPIISKEEGKEQVQAFLDVGEINIPVISWFYTDFDGSLERFYQQLRPKASKGTPIVRNDMTDYLAQDDTAPGFDRPCFNPTECPFEPSGTVTT